MVMEIETGPSLRDYINAKKEVEEAIAGAVNAFVAAHGVPVTNLKFGIKGETTRITEPGKSEPIPVYAVKLEVGI